MGMVVFNIIMAHQIRRKDEDRKEREEEEQQRRDEPNEEADAQGFED